MKSKIQKRILFTLLLALLLFPFVQSQLNLFEEPPLDGAFEKPSAPELKWFTWKSWFNEKFQNDFNKSLEEHTGLKNTFIRVNNQINYSFFNKTTTHKALIGKKGCLYEEGYIWEYSGRGFVGEDSVNNVLHRTKLLQHYLKKNKNIDLIIVFEPGKASFFPEYIPNRFNIASKTTSNYDYYAKRCAEMQINFLDLNDLFKKMKDTVPHPLYPMYGIHWSTYGMCIAADTLIKFIEKTHNISMPKMYWDSITVTDNVKDADFDIEKTLNLLWRLPKEKMAYPHVKFEKDINKVKPDVLVIADSYFWSIYDNEIPHNVFNNHEFWYYNKAKYPDIFDDTIDWVDHSKTKEVVEGMNVILIMVTEMNLNHSFWCFIDQLYEIYGEDIHNSL